MRSRSPKIGARIAGRLLSRGLVTLADCTSDQQYLEQGRDEASVTALERARFGLNCLEAAASVLLQKLVQSPVVASAPRAVAASPAMESGSVADRWRWVNRLVGASLVLSLAACQRQALPVCAAPLPALEPAPAATSGEQLTVARACASDIERFCAGVLPRQGIIKDCMKSHVTELSAGCFDAVMAAIASQQTP